MPADPGANILPLRPRDHEDAARLAIQWLEDRHRKGWAKALHELLDTWRPEGVEGVSQLGDEGLQMLVINAGEWLLARGEIHARGGPRPINDYLLGPGGPYLSPNQQRWIAQLCERPLRLYRVTEVRLDEGLTLVDELDADAAPQVVREISGSRSARPGMLMAARVMHAGQASHEHLELSGAIYPFAKLRESQAIARVRDAQAGAEEMGLHPDNVRDLIEVQIASTWMAQWFEPVRLPEIRDAGSGDLVLLVTDHYRVNDAAALAAALAREPDVSGDAAAGWHRQVDIGEGSTRLLAAINPGKGADRVEVFYRTQRMADEGRAWFDRVACAAVVFLTREIVDPAGAMSQGEVSRATPAPADTLPPEVIAQAVEQLLRRHYANWCDEPIPLLGDKTPRQAIATPSGLERVKGLLREYEDGERRQNQAQGRPALSFQFLWDALGISR